MTRIVLDPANPRDIDLVAHAQWDLTCVTGKPFGDLSRPLQARLRIDARTFLEALAQRPGVTTLRDESQAQRAA